MTDPNADPNGRGQPNDEQVDIHLADWLTPEQADEAQRIFAGLRAARRSRDGQVDRVGDAGVALLGTPGGRHAVLAAVAAR